nr:zinc ribbon domain-containing protein [Rhodococcus sp. (in: high G+C Gram-positive bacteria)]
MPVRPRPRRGLFDDIFWGHVAQRRLHLQRCAACGSWQYPPVPSCPSCSSRDLRWTPSCSNATLLSWVTFEKTYFDSIPAPYTVAACRLDEGPVLLADTAEAVADLAIDDRMMLQYYDAEDQFGAPFKLYRWARVE